MSNLFEMNEETLPSEDLLNAASFGRADNIKKALARGADPNYARIDIAPTLIAAMREYTDCIQVLMEAGARFDAKSRAGWTAIHEASIKDTPDILKIFLEYAPIQGSLMVRDKEGASILHSALEFSRLENATLIVNAHPDLLSAKDNAGETVVYRAIRSRNEEVFEWCMERGISLTSENEQGVSASQLLLDWEQGQRIAHQTIKVDFASVEKLKSRSTAMEEEKAAAEEPVANPFGLGGVKKKKLS